MLRNPSVFAVAGLGEDLLCCFSKRMGGRGGGVGGDGASNPEPPLTPALAQLRYADSEPCKDACLQVLPYQCIPERERRLRRGLHYLPLGQNPLISSQHSLQLQPEYSIGRIYLCPLNPRQDFRFWKKVYKLSKSYLL